MSVESDAQEIIKIIENIKAQKFYKEEFFRKLSSASAENEFQVNQILKGRNKQDILEQYNKYASDLLDDAEKANQRIMAEFENVPLPKKEELPRFVLSKMTKKRYLKEVGIDEQILKRLYKKKQEKKTEVEYTVYEPNLYGKISNVFFKEISRTIISSYPNFFKNLNSSLRMSDIKVLSQTYISSMLFSSLISLILVTTISLIINFFLKTRFEIGLFISLILGLAGSILAFFILYIYPSIVVGARRRQIKNDLPFAVIHMSAIAGSGAQPLSMFKLLLSSKEYKGLDSEIRKIVNYVNLFGYDLSTALKTVASTTPSTRLKDILIGIASTIESGGSLRSYLSAIADETMNTYRLERKKFLETLSTYSEIYTGILIAAPLLFLVTLAIINVLGGTVAGFDVKTLAIFGTYAIIPFLNIAFLLFINIIQPEA